MLKGHSLLHPPHLMGVVNLSPDSWYRESVCLNTEQALRRARKLTAEGADLVDVGGESTLPHAERIDVDKQIQRLKPVVEGMSHDGILASVETYHPDVAEVCLKAGAAVLNLTGPSQNQKMFDLAAQHQAGVIICYVQAAHVREAEDFNVVEDHLHLLHTFFKEQITAAEKAGVQAIWMDPGLGFYYRNLGDSAQRVRYQWRTLLETFRLHDLGWPVCHALPHAFEFFGEEVRSAESLFAVAALLGKTSLLRTHEVSKIKAIVDTMTCLNPS